jgi:NTP pyrophosphatase (non-canonical NTP hydrolase)
MELNQLLKYIEQMKMRRGFNGASIEQEMVLLTEEVGELAHEVWEVVKAGGASDDLRRDLAFEVVDCLIFLLSIAGMAGIEDIEGYFREKEVINRQRFE